MRDFRELKVWQKAHQVALNVFRHSRSFPAEERFGLTAHLRKSATSVPSNIAEGCGRDTEKELGRFLSIAAGSASELEYQLLLGTRPRVLAARRLRRPQGASRRGQAHALPLHAVVELDGLMLTADG
jgi:four helix bundle protein